jgi:hypothetical protein
MGKAQAHGSLHRDMGIATNEPIPTAAILEFMRELVDEIRRTGAARRAALVRKLRHANLALTYRRYRGRRPKLT